MSKIIPVNPTNNEGLQLSPITVDPEYAAKWNIMDSTRDFLLLTMNGQPVRNTLYRKGGIPIGTPKDDFFMILKYVEEYYDDNITTDPLRKPHLSGYWCIINGKGKEVHVSEENYMSNLHLIKDTCIYSDKNAYYNGHNNEFYGYADKYLESDDYIILDCKKSMWKSEQLPEPAHGYGLHVINKKTGEVIETYEVTPHI